MSPSHLNQVHHWVQKGQWFLLVPLVSNEIESTSMYRQVHLWQTVATGRLVLPLDADHPVPMERTAWIYSELQKQCSLETVKRHEHHPYYTSVLMPVEPYVFPAISSVPRANLAVANRLIGGTIYKAYFFRELNINDHFRNLNWRYLPYIRPKIQGISPENMAKHMVRSNVAPLTAF